MITINNTTQKIGLTGGIGSGKSTVSSIFDVLGIPVFHSDTAAKQIILENEQVRENILSTFGKNSYRNDGSYNTKHISEIVFNDKTALKQLNNIVHPIVFQQQADWFEKQTTPYSIVENAILFETHTAHRFDKVIVVQTNDNLRVKRIMQRDGISKAEVQKRFNSQIPQEKKVKKADYVIYNNGDQSLIKQVMSIHERLKK